MANRKGFINDSKGSLFKKEKAAEAAFY